MSAALVGVAEHYAQFVKLCRTRIEQLGINYETVDALCGFQQGYTATLMCGTKSLSMVSFFNLLETLALTVAFHHSEERLSRLRKRSDWILTRRKGTRYRRRRGAAVRFVNHIDFYRQIGRKGAIKANALRRRRKEAARTAAMARWNND